MAAHKFDSLWVIMDRLTKSAHFIPINTHYKVQKYAEIYIARVVEGRNLSLAFGSNYTCPSGLILALV
jgi:hypothetical protein